MKKGVAMFFALVLLISLVPAQEQVQTYSGFDRFFDSTKMFFSSGDKKVMLALEIREKELNSAIANANSGNIEEAIENLDSASDKLLVVKEKTSLDISEEVKNNIGEIQDKIAENTQGDSEINQYFKEYLTEEQRTKLSVELSEKTFNYCEELAMQDYEMALEDEKCTAYSWMEKEIEQKINEEQEKSQNEIQNEIQSCMNNPKKCNCDEISLLSERKKCEEYKALAIKCEFQNDGSACKEIEKFRTSTTEKEEYERKILEQYVPGECLEAGVKDGEECKKLIITINRPESECKENGEYLGEEKCQEKLVEEGKVVKECVVDGKLVDPNQCLNIVKENNKPDEREIELMSGECKERGIYDPVACGEIVNLPPSCKDAGYYTKKECESFTLEQTLPQECVEAGTFTPEACEKLKLPSDCQGAYSKEECEKIKIEQKFPEECKSAGELDPAKCAVIMIGEQSLVVTAGAEMEYLVRQGLTFEEIPSVCMNGKNFIRSMECDAELAKLGITLLTPTNTGTIPKECMIDEKTAVSPQECQNKIEKNIIVDTMPKECQDAEATTPEMCGKFMEEQRIQEGIGINMPEECIGVSVEECKTIMNQKGIKFEKIEQIQKVEKVEKVEKVQKMCKEGEECEEEAVEYEEVAIPKECIELGIADYDTCKISMSKINEERIKQGDEIIIDEEGNVDYITNEEIDKLAERAEKKSQELKPDMKGAEKIKGELDVLEKGIQEIEKKGMTEEIGSSEMKNEIAGEKSNGEIKNEVSNEVASGGDSSQENSEGNQVVESSGSSESSNSESDGGDSGMTGAVVGSSNKESFLGKIIKKIFSK